ncbi:MAG: filamentous hemagglutinin family N-terminal domain protein, partial [Phycisphaerales bacterium]|nr:filamentous hemagglutinin family N-terminal domain protein [Phycisphaerales bacterium]
MNRSIRSRRAQVGRPAVEAIEPRRLMASVPVTNNNDAGPGSLRAAILAAAANDTVDLTARTGTITLANPLIINRALNVVGPGTDVLTISGGDTTGGFSTYNGSRLAISGLTLSHFTANAGGGTGGGAVCAIFTNGASFFLDHVNFNNNHISGKPYAPAVTLERAGTLSMVDCNVTDNTGESSGGGVYTYGSQFSAVRCTFARNTALYGGAGLKLIFNTLDELITCTIAENTADGGSQFFTNGAGMSCASGGTLTMTNCTIVRNNSIHTGNSISGGGLYIQLPSVAAGRSVTLTNTIVAGNINGSRGDLALGSVTDPSIFHARNCLIGDGDGSGLIDGADGNRVGTRAVLLDARLGTLGIHGGTTATVPLLPGSPAIDTGAPAADVPVVPLADQRGIERLGNADIGAYEVHPIAPVFLDGPMRSASAGPYYVVAVHTSDVDRDVISISGTGLPHWLTLTDQHDGTATIIGMPSVSDAGTVTFAINASDGQSTTTQSWTVEVAALPPVLFPPMTLPAATAGEHYSAVITAVVGGSFGYSIEGRLLPDWLTLTDRGDGTAVLDGLVPAQASASLNIGVFAAPGRTG